MTEYETLDIMTNLMDVITADHAIYLTELTAYLIAIYMVGKKLTFFQLSFLNFLLLWFVITDLVTTIAHVGLISTYAEKLYEFRPQEEGSGIPIAFTYVFISFKIMVAFGCYMFMWQVRHDKQRVIKTKA